MPAFTVIAGPNGAGKSSYSKALSPKKAVIFDPDAVKKEILQSYPDISEEAVETELTRVYDNFEKKALAEYLDFTVETSLRTTFLADRARKFKEKGYDVNLIFMMLPDITHSTDRVNLRVKKKGHFVDQESIKINFDLSRENVKACLPIFDNTMVLDASSDEGAISTPRLLGKFLDFQVSMINDIDQPEWADDYIAELCKVIASNHLERHRRETGRRHREKMKEIFDKMKGNPKKPGGSSF